MTVLSLEGLIDPISRETFLEQYLGQNFVFLPGRRGRFHELLSWNELNGLLRNHTYQPSQIRVVKETKLQPAETYLLNDGSVSPAVTDYLRDGATLILNGIHQRHEAIHSLSEQLEQELETRVQVNMYAAWHSQKGFDLHWDDHDVFILQIAGRKYWEIHGETFRHPLGQQSSPMKTPPSGGPVWKKVLEDGDVLYIPRGFWHVVTPCDEPTIHLTVGLYHPTAVTLLNWLTERLIEQPVFRQDVPRFAGAAEQEAYMAAVSLAVGTVLTEGNVVRKFRSYLNGMASSRRVFSLPTAAATERIPSEAGSVIVPRWSRNLQIQEGAQGTIDVLFEGRRITFPAAVEPLLSDLSELALTPLHEFYERHEEQVERSEIAGFLDDLVGHGLVAVRRPSVEAEPAARRQPL